MTAVEGFLVVEKQPPDLQTSPNKAYRGLYRTPPWDQDSFDGGFDDPYVLGQVSDAGLIPTRQLAEDALAKFAELSDPSDLEVIFARQVAPPVVEQLEGLEQLGFDVCCAAPFWSILADPPVDRAPQPEITKVLVAVNEHGLLANPLDAFALRDKASSEGWIDAGVELGVWQVALANG